jgi:hypothetical protein
MSLSLSMDIIIIVMLAATIFYALRLTQHLNKFRSNRQDMERLIRELSMQITRAQEGVSALDEVSRTLGDELRSSITKGCALADELTIITEAGDNLAARLENLATRNRALADDMSQRAVNLVYPGDVPLPSDRPAPEPLRASRAEVKIDAPSFSIRDPEFMNDDDDVFQSEAERDLAAALRTRRGGE